MIEQFFEPNLADALRKANELAQNRKMKIIHFQFESVQSWYRLVVLYEKAK